MNTEDCQSAAGFQASVRLPDQSAVILHIAYHISREDIHGFIPERQPLVQVHIQDIAVFLPAGVRVRPDDRGTGVRDDKAVTVF